MNLHTPLPPRTEPQFWPSLGSTCEWIAARAAQAESDPTGLAPELARLGSDGLLKGCLPMAFGGSDLGLTQDSASRTFEILRHIGRASLPVARLLEGHMNAAKLISLYGTLEQKNQFFAQDTSSAFFGVWGAEGARPATFRERSGGKFVLSGQKAFTSGLGSVETAVITAKAKDSPGGRARLLLVNVTDKRRQNPAVWHANGMKATLSGTFDFDEMEILPDNFLGRAGDYEKEPHFDGGIWRYCAAHIGGAEAVIDASLAVVRARRHIEDPIQLARFGHAIAKTRAATSLVREWACRVEGATEGAADTPVDAVAGIVLARAVVYDMCEEVLQICERSVGTAAFMQGQDVDRLCRDLSLYIRQAAPDAKLLKATSSLLGVNRGNSSLW